MVYGAHHRAGQLGETGPPRPFYAARSELMLLGILTLSRDRNIQQPLRDRRARKKRQIAHISSSVADKAFL